MPMVKKHRAKYHSQAMPLHATHHCRFYHHEGGPKCDMQLLGENDIVLKCLPNPPALIKPCNGRKEFTANERAEWDDYVSQSQVLLSNVIGHVPRPVMAGETLRFACPNCDGTAKVIRSKTTSLFVQCNCIGLVHLTLKSNDDSWPS
jgi:hypothetical protein